MKYAKLIDGDILQVAPNPILVDGNYIGNPPGSIYETEGYKPVVYNDPPGDPPAGYDWQEVWTEEEDSIVQSWVPAEAPDDVSAEEAIEYLFGGES